jgi:hypothetical protein
MTAPDFTRDARLAELFGRWRTDIDSVPMPTLVDLATAVAIVCEGRRRAGTSPDDVPARRSGPVP